MCCAFATAQSGLSRGMSVAKSVHKVAQTHQYKRHASTTINHVLVTTVDMFDLIAHVLLPRAADEWN
jgi:hypothetical protein